MTEEPIHVAMAGTDTPACGALDAAEVVPLEEALRADGRYFTCKACLKILTGGRRRSGP